MSRPVGPRAQVAQHGTHWREYPIGFCGEMAVAVVGTLIAFLCGVGAAGALVLTIGLAAEESLLPSLELNLAADSLARVALVVLVGLGWLAGLALTVARGVKEVATSRALARAAESGAPRRAVPHPSQVEHVIAKGFGAFLWFGGATIGLAGLFLLIGLAAVFDSSGWEGIEIVGSGLAVLALLGATMIWIVKRARPAQRTRRARIAQHWTTADEELAWTWARDSDAGEYGSAHVQAAGDVEDRGRRIVGGNILISAGGSCAGLSVVLLQLLLAFTHPDAQHWPGGSVGDRTQLSDRAEELVALGFWGILVFVVVGVMLLAAGFFVSGAAQTAERAFLRRAVADPAARRPSQEVLQRYSERHPVLLAQWFAALGGVGICAGLSVIVLTSGVLDDVADVYSGSAAVFAGLSGWSVLVTMLSVLLALAALMWNARSNLIGNRLRDELMSRWPTPPDAKPDDDGESNPARLGPALTGPVTSDRIK